MCSLFPNPPFSFFVCVGGGGGGGGAVFIFVMFLVSKGPICFQIVVDFTSADVDVSDVLLYFGTAEPISVVQRPARLYHKGRVLCHDIHQCT